MENAPIIHHLRPQSKQENKLNRITFFKNGFEYNAPNVKLSIRLR